jgi:hypothetical protein
LYKKRDLAYKQLGKKSRWKGLFRGKKIKYYASNGKPVYE